MNTTLRVALVILGGFRVHDAQQKGRKCWERK